MTTQLLDKSEAGKKQNVFTIVKAPEMVYDDKERLAHYKGGAMLNRAGMIVSAQGDSGMAEVRETRIPASITLSPMAP